MNIQKVLKILELPLNSIVISPNMPLDIAANRLIKFKDVVKKQRKQLAKKYHPDKGGDISIMQSINEAADIVDKLKIHVQRIVPRPANHINITIHFTDTGFKVSSNTF
jgi:hypothetical protein